MNMKQVWGVAGGFFLVYILISVTNRPSVQPRAQATLPPQAQENPQTPPPAAEAEPASPLVHGLQLSGLAGLSVAACDQALGTIAQSGARWVVFGPTCRPEGNAAPASGETEAVSHAIEKSHELGLKVLLRPELELGGFQAEDFSPTDTSAWFSHYAHALEPWSQLASDKRVDLLCVGARLTHLENAAQWHELIASVKRRYGGALTYAAAYQPAGSYQKVAFWNELDYIDLDGPLPGGDWEQSANDIDGWMKTQSASRPVLLSNLGEAGSLTPDGVQACSRSLMSRNWFGGAFWSSTGDAASLAAFTPASTAPAEAPAAVATEAPTAAPTRDAGALHLVPVGNAPAPAATSF